MDLNTLQAQHPDVYAAAVEMGANAERDRVAAHLTMGDASGDMATAITAINEGSAMTASLQATYMAAGMNRSDTQTRQNESDNADAGDNAGASTEEQEATAGANILAAAAAA